MNLFRERLESLVAELTRHPRVRVTHFWMGPRATEAELSEVERVVGPLPPSVRAFYAAVNGVQLRWIDRESPEYTDADEGPMGTTYVLRMAADAHGGDGLVDIGPVATLLDVEDIYSDGDEVRAFDTIDDIGMVAFARGAAVTTRLRVGSDHNVEWDAIPFDFTEYLELLLATLGFRRLAFHAFTLPVRQRFLTHPLAHLALLFLRLQPGFLEHARPSHLLQTRVHVLAADPS